MNNFLNFQETESLVNIRLKNIDERFEEIDTLLALAKANKDNIKKYSSLCRSAHVLLVSHVEGIYKDIVKDIIDDLNYNSDFKNLPKPIFHTFSHHFLSSNDNKDSKKNYEIIERLKEAFKEYKTNISKEPFLRVDNKNPTPKILEEILLKFGESNFFRYLSESKFEIVFENNDEVSLKELKRIKRYTINSTKYFPYTTDKNFYFKTDNKKLSKKGLFEEFLDEFLRDRHSIVHGHRLDSPKNDLEIFNSKLKIEFLIYAFIICLCSNSIPIYFLNYEIDF